MNLSSTTTLPPLAPLARLLAAHNASFYASLRKDAQDRNTSNCAPPPQTQHCPYESVMYFLAAEASFDQAEKQLRKQKRRQAAILAAATAKGKLPLALAGPSASVGSHDENGIESRVCDSASITNIPKMNLSTTKSIVKNTSVPLVAFSVHPEKASKSMIIGPRHFNLKKRPTSVGLPAITSSAASDDVPSHAPKKRRLSSTESDTPVNRVPQSPVSEQFSKMVLSSDERDFVEAAQRLSAFSSNAAPPPRRAGIVSASPSIVNSPESRAPVCLTQTTVKPFSELYMKD